MKFKFNLGDKVKHTITPFEGIVISRTEWYNGCLRYMVQSQDLKDGKPVDPQSFDDEELVAAGEGVKPSRRETGGPMPAPPKTGR